MLLVEMMIQLRLGVKLVMMLLVGKLSMTTRWIPLRMFKRFVSVQHIFMCVIPICLQSVKQMLAIESSVCSALDG